MVVSPLSPFAPQAPTFASPAASRWGTFDPAPDMTDGIDEAEATRGWASLEAGIAPVLGTRD